jgi:uncharacterized membrane protein
MASLDALRTQMGTLAQHLAEARSRAAAVSSGDADIREIAARHAALSARLATATDADTQVKGEVEALLSAFGRWAADQDRRFDRP